MYLPDPISLLPFLLRDNNNHEFAFFGHSNAYSRPITEDVFVVQSLNCVQFFATPWTTAHQPPLSSAISWSLLKFLSIELVMLSNHLIFCHPLLFPSIRVFSKDLALCIRWPKYWSFSKIFRKSVFGRKWFRIYNQGYITNLLVFSDENSLSPFLSPGSCVLARQLIRESLRNKGRAWGKTEVQFWPHTL